MINKDVKKFLKRIKENPNPAIPKEGFSNSMTTPNKPISFLFRPNNYRRQMRVGIKTNSTVKKIINTIPKATTGKHNKLISIKNYQENITLQYGVETLTAIHKQHTVKGHKETFLIEADTIDQINKRIDYYKNIAKEKMDYALDCFAKKFRIVLPYEKKIWGRAENWIKGEEFIDSIPIECIIHDTHFKKVYTEGLEFMSGKGQDPTATIKTYIKNRCIEDISPEILKRLENIENKYEKQYMDFYEKAVIPIQEQIVTHLKRLRKEIRDFQKNQKREIKQVKSQKSLKDF